jgi:sulfur-oxidizing protein SoxX
MSRGAGRRAPVPAGPATAAILAGLALLAALTGAGCAATAPDQQLDLRVAELMQSSFKPHGQANLDRLAQDDLQAACSRLPRDAPLPRDAVDQLERAQLAAIRYPISGELIGDWRAGERIAQRGTGMQYSDDPNVSAGGNCYACHQLTMREVSYGTIGPSLYRYGARRGRSVEVQRATYGKIYNAAAFHACTAMPRFGRNGILTETQIKDLVALLLDPDSPVNQ